MIKIKNGQLESRQFNEALNSLSDEKMPAESSFQIAIILNKIKELQQIIVDQRKKILNKYDIPIKEKIDITTLDEDIQVELQKDINELSNVEAEIGASKLRKSALMDTNMKPKELAELMPLIDMER